MLRLVFVRLRRLLGDWRFLLALVGLAFYIHWEITGSMIDSNASKFLRRYDSVYFAGSSPRAIAHNLGLDEYGPDGFETMYDVWEAYKQGSPTRTEFHFLGAVCNGGLSQVLAYILLSVWIIGSGRGTSAMLMRGHRRFAVFLASFLVYFLLTMLLLAGMMWVELATLPIGFRYLPEGFAEKSIRLWLLFIAMETCVFALPAFAFSPLAAVGIDLGLALVMAFSPSAKRLFFPLGITGSKDLWRVETGFGVLEKAAVAAAVVLVFAVAASWLVFRKKELR